MMRENEEIKFSGDELICALSEIEIILISLDRLGAYFGTKHYNGVDKKEYEAEVTKFVEDWKVVDRLVKVRRVLSEKFDSTLGDDNMDDLERGMTHIKYWRSPGSKPCE